MSDDVVAVLQRAKERVAAGWMQGHYHNHAMTHFCAWGAIDACGDDWSLEIDRAEKFLCQAIGTKEVASWNDAPGRTQADVLDAFEKAIRLAKDAP